MSDFHLNGACIRTIGVRGGITEHSEVWRVAGQTKVWKTRPGEYRIPVKHGLRSYGAITHENRAQFHTPEECPLRHTSGPVGRQTPIRDAKRIARQLETTRRDANNSAAGIFPGRGARITSLASLSARDRAMLDRYLSKRPLPKLAPAHWEGPDSPPASYYQRLGYGLRNDPRLYPLEAGDRVVVKGALLGNIAAVWGESAYVLFTDTRGAWVSRDAISRAASR